MTMNNAHMHAAKGKICRRPDLLLLLSLLLRHHTHRQDLGQQLLVLVPVRVRRELLARLDVTQRAAPVGWIKAELVRKRARHAKKQRQKIVASLSPREAPSAPPAVPYQRPHS